MAGGRKRPRREESAREGTRVRDIEFSTGFWLRALLVVAVLGVAVVLLWPAAGPGGPDGPAQAPPKATELPSDVTLSEEHTAPITMPTSTPEAPVSSRTPPQVPPPQALQPQAQRSAPVPPPPPVLPVRVERLRVRVLGEYPHDRQAFTQGLLWHYGTIYESTGVHGQSTLRRVDLATGELLQRLPLAQNYFGEGLERVGDRLVQLTWRSGTALVYDLETFRSITSFHYQGEGWGLCFNGRDLVMSNGSSHLTLRDPESFQVNERVEVTLEQTPLRWLNELECVGGAVYANIYQQDWIARIDGRSGRVTAVIDASGLLPREERMQVDVLNGIAYVPERDVFLLTGKYWPKVFEVVFEPQP